MNERAAGFVSLYLDILYPISPALAKNESASTTHFSIAPAPLNQIRFDTISGTQSHISLPTSAAEYRFLPIAPVSSAAPHLVYLKSDTMFLLCISR